MKFPKQKRRSYKTIKDSLDRYYAKCIRLRDTFINDNDGLRYGYCCSCGKLYHISGLECGHFVARQNMAVRWSVKNTYAQCTNCNHYNEGEHWKMGVFIDRKHGKGTSAMLEIEGSKNKRFERHELEAREEFYKNECKKLLKGKTWKEAIA